MKLCRAVRTADQSEIASAVRVARSLWSRFWGLMGQRELAEGQAMLIDPCTSVHTFFMRFPIDVVFLDRENRVVKVVPALRPYRMAMGGGGKRVLEMRPGAAAGLRPGDQIQFEERPQD